MAPSQAPPPPKVPPALEREADESEEPKTTDDPLRGSLKTRDEVEPYRAEDLLTDEREGLRGRGAQGKGHPPPPQK